MAGGFGTGAAYGASEGEVRLWNSAIGVSGIFLLHVPMPVKWQLDQIAPAEITGLRELYTAIREGHTTWREVMSEKRGETPEAEGESKGTRSGVLKDKLRKTKGTSTRQAATDDKGGASSVPADTSGPTGTATTEASAKPTVPAHVSLIESYRAKLTPMAFAVILQKARAGHLEGFKAVESVPAEVAEQIIFDLEDEIRGGKQ